MGTTPRRSPCLNLSFTLPGTPTLEFALSFDRLCGWEEEYKGRKDKARLNRTKLSREEGRAGADVDHTGTRKKGTAIQLSKSVPAKITFLATKGQEIPNSQMHLLSCQ